MSQELNSTLVIFAIFVSALGGALIPIVAIPVTPRITKIGNAFSAGFLSAAALVHLLPPAHDSMKLAVQNFSTSDHFSKFPYDGIATLFGATLVFLIDSAMRTNTSNKTSDVDVDVDVGRNSNSNAISDRDTDKNINITNTNNTVSNEISNCESTHTSSPSSPSSCKEHSESDPLLNFTKVPHRHHHEQNKNQRRSSISIPFSSPPSTSSSISKNKTTTDPNSSKVTLSLVFATTLSFHSLMEGITLGASLLHTKQFMVLAIAILAHKLFAALSLGTSLAAASPKNTITTMSILTAFAFAFSTPLGALLGALIVSTTVQSVLVSATLTCMSAGIFLYVAFVDLLAEEVRECACDDHDRFLRGVLFVCAASAMSLLAIWV